MLRKILLVGAGLVALTAATSANAQSSASVNGTASVTLLKPIAITTDRALAFGRVVSSGTAGTVTIAATSNATAGSASNVTLLSSTTSSARFAVTGEPSTTYTINAPSTITFGGSPPAGLDITSVSTATANNTGALDNLGNDTIYIGGVLNVPANAGGGLYSATYNVTVSYQ